MSRKTLITLILCSILVFVGAMTAAAQGQGGNQDCPEGTVLIAKFEYEQGQYVYDGGVAPDAVTITNGTATGGNWSTLYLISHIIVKGGPGSTIEQIIPPTTSGTFDNANLPPVGSGNTPDVSNVKFCGTGQQAIGSITLTKRVSYLSQFDFDSDQVFSFTGDLGDFDLANEETKAFTDLAPDDYAITELLPAGWALSSVSCQNNTDNDIRIVSGVLIIGLDAGENITCQITNHRTLGQLRIVKVVEGNASADDWEFNLQLGDVTHPIATIPGEGGETQSIMLPVGTYRLSEVLQDGYDVTDIDCGDAGSNVDLETGSIDVTVRSLGYVQFVTCTVTNTQRGSITLSKQIHYQSQFDFDSDQVFSFTGSLGDFDLENGETKAFTNLVEGDYAITELLPEGWMLGSVACQNNTGGDISVRAGVLTIGLDPGENITCQITNRRITGQIRIIKVVEGNASANDWAFNLQLGDVTAEPVATLPGGGGDTGYIMVPIGTYRLSEVLQDGYEVTGIDCGDAGSNVDLSTGSIDVTIQSVAFVEGVTCTVTNTQHGSLTITKIVDYRSTFDIDSDQVFSFNGTFGEFELANGETKSFLNLPQGEYQIVEDEVDGWFMSVVACQNNDNYNTFVDFGTRSITIGVDPGENITCQIVNRRFTGRLKIIKVIDGNASADDWEFNLERDGVTAEPLVTLPGEGGESEFVTLPIGTYRLSEVLQDGYEVTDIDCGDAGSNVDLATGSIDVTIPSTFSIFEGVTCTVTNTQRGSITIGKRVEYQSNFDIDSDQTFNFTGDLGDFELANGETEAFLNLPVGEYQITEELMDGWLFFSVYCEGNDDNDFDVNFATGTLTIGLDPGENIYCRFSNDRSTGDILVHKYNDLNGNGQKDDGEGPLQGWEFVIKHNGNVISLPTFTDGDGMIRFDNLPTATYEVCETQQPGWTNTDPGGNNCETVELNVRNELAPVYFGNHEDPPAARLTIIKDAVPNTPTDFYFTVNGPTEIAPFALDDDFSGALSNTSDTFEVEPGTYVVREATDELYYLHSVVCWDAQNSGFSAYSVDELAGTVTVDLAAGDDVRCKFTNKPQGAIVAVKYYDRNQNGQLNLFEPLLGGWTINLYAADGTTLLDSEQTSYDLLTKGITTFGPLLPGTYVVCEELQPGWTNSTPLCQTVEVGSADIDTVKFGNYETPVATGSITIIKEVLSVSPSGTKFFFEVSQGDTGIADGIQLANGESETVSDLAPGTYTVEEVFIGFGSGWSFGGAVCTNGDQEISIPADPSGNNTSIDVEVGEGEDWTCTFTNRARVSLRIDKVTDPAGDTTEFTFHQDFRNFDTTFVLTDESAPKSFIEGTAGTYHITEDAVPGWTLNQVVCEGVVSQTEIEGGVEIVLDWGAQADCTFYNVKDTVELCVEGGDPKADLKVTNFVYDPSSGIASAVVTNQSDECSYTVGMASYQKYDEVLANQVLFDSMPDVSTNPDGDGSTEVGPGESITLRVQVPECAAQIDVFFDASHLYPLYTANQANADQPPLVLETFDSGSFGPLGNRYGQRLLAAKHVNGTLWCDTPPGECTIGNMSVSGIVEGGEVSGVVDIQALFAGSNPDRVEFSLTGPWNRDWTENISPYYFLGDSNGGQPNGWNTDNYPEGEYTMVVRSFQGNRLCDEITINFRVDRTPERKITIQKVSDPGYDAQVYFDGDLPDVNGDAPGIFNTNGMGGLYTYENLAPGVYNVTELVPDGYDLTSVTCNLVEMPIVDNGVDIDVTEGDATCTFYNTAEPAPEPGSITIIKDRYPDGASMFPFEIRQGDTVIASGSFGEGSPYTESDLPPGTYTVEEMFGGGFGSGYVFGGAVCTNGVDEVSLPEGSNIYHLDIEVGAGEDWTCTFTNLQRVTVTITKQTVPDGDPTVFTWHQDFRPTLPESFELSDGETQQYVEGRAGTFTFTEDAVPGWTLTSVVCDEGIVNPLPNGFEITLDWGQTPECTATNEFTEEPPYEEPELFCPANYTKIDIVTHSALLTQVYNTSYSYPHLWVPQDSEGFLRVWSKVGHPEAGCPGSGAPICDADPLQDGESFFIDIAGSNFFVPDHGNDQWQMFDFDLDLPRNLYTITFTHSFQATNNPWGSVNFNAVYCAAPADTQNPDEQPSVIEEPVNEEPTIEEPVIEEPTFEEEQQSTPENRQPSLSLVSLFSFVGDVVDLQVVAQDEDGDALTFSFVNLPQGVTDDGSGHLIGVIAPVQQRTEYLVEVSVSDGKGGTASGTFMWVVQPVAAPPFGSMTNTEGDPINVGLPPLNYPGLQVSFNYVGLPTGLSFDPISGAVFGTAPQVDADTPFNVTLTITVTAPGQGSGTATVNFTWTILNVQEAAPMSLQSAPVDQPPAEQPPAEQPPAEQPPAEQPPAEQPPAEQPPAEEPPAEQPPAEGEGD